MSVKLYCGDCLDIMPTLGKVDAVVTDPPYGTGAWKRISSGQGRNPSGFLSKEDWDSWSIDWLEKSLLITKRIAAFIPSTKIAECMAFGESRLFIWIKSDPRPRFLGQPAYGFEPLLVIGGYNNIGGVDYMIDSSPRLNRDSDGTGHPHQKPIDVCKWAVELTTLPGDTILDPFMGSGTTGVACVRTGRNFIGIEKEPKYFEIAQRRIAEAELQPALFQLDAPKSMEVQEALL